MAERRENGRYVLSGGAHLSVDTRKVEECHGRHWHRYFELELVLSGEGVCRVNDISYDMTEYRLFFLAPTDFHEVYPKGELLLVNISFDEEMIEEEAKSMALLFGCDRAYALTDEEHARFSSACALLLHENTQGGDSERRLLGYILSSMLRKSTARLASSPLKNAHFGTVLRAYAYMQTHFKEKITLEDLSAQAGYHPTYFSEIFKKATGENYVVTLARFRIAHARALLAEGASVSEACFGSGFSSLSQFLATFKKHCGISPSDYKKQSAGARFELLKEHSR